MQRNSSGQASVVIKTVVTILIVGVSMAFVRQQFGFYLMLLFPLLMGAAAGAMAHGWRTQLGLSNSVMYLIAAVSGIFIYATYRVADYFFFISKLTGEVAPTFIEYTQLQALVGVSISGRSGNGLNLTDSAAYIYWVIEIILIVIASVYVARHMAAAIVTKPSST